MQKPIMKQNNENNKENQQVKAARILELTEELQDLQIKRKAVAGAFTSRIKEVKQDIHDVLNNVQTADEIVENIHTEHDLEIVK